MTIQVPATFRAMPRWWHDLPGRAWLDQLPHLVDDVCRRWELRLDGDPRHGSNALVVPVLGPSGPAALRLAPPGDDLATECRALQLWSGRGTVLLEGFDLDRRVMLLERLDPDRSLSTLEMPAAVEVLVDLVHRLAVAVPPEVTSTATVAADLIESLTHDWDRLDRPAPLDQLDIAVDLATELAALEPAGTAVDADLHCGQVLAGDREPWLVVDPVLLRGDSEHDFARVLWDRLDELDDDAIRRLTTRFSAGAGVPPERTRAWIVLRSMSYLLWGLDHGLTEDPMRCRRLLDLFC